MTSNEGVTNMRIEIPEVALVVLIGASSSGKSEFAKRFFEPAEALSFDNYRTLVSGDNISQHLADRASFAALCSLACNRLENGLLTVIDAANLDKHNRTFLTSLAKARHSHAVAIVLDMPMELCKERNSNRTNCQVSGKQITHQINQLRNFTEKLCSEGFNSVYVLKSEDDVNNTEIIRKRLSSNRKDEPGPFDIIGDIHGCFRELCMLLRKLGYAVDEDKYIAIPPTNRRAVFLGDLCDRGPQNVDVLRLVMGMVRSSSAYCIIGNHDDKLLRKLCGSDVQMTHGLDVTFEQLTEQGDGFVAEVKTFLECLDCHYIFNNGRLVVAHAGLIEEYQGRDSRKVRNYCMYGESTGEVDGNGIPERVQWANDYSGNALVVYGHTVVSEIENFNNTICIDTGCVFGRKLTSLRYPEMEVVQVDAQQIYYKSILQEDLIKNAPSNQGVKSIENISAMNTAKTDYGKAKKLYYKGDFSKAMVYFKKAADYNYKDAIAWVNRINIEMNLEDYIEQMDKIILFESTDRKSCGEIGFTTGTLYAEILDGCLRLTFSLTVLARTVGHNSHVSNYYFDKDNTRRFITALTGVEIDFTKVLSYHFNDHDWYKKLRELCENNIIEYRRNRKL
jgi:polynucleotide kinase-phosphatase